MSIENPEAGSEANPMANATTTATQSRIKIVPQKWTNTTAVKWIVLASTTNENLSNKQSVLTTQEDAVATRTENTTHPMSAEVAACAGCVACLEAATKARPRVTTDPSTTTEKNTRSTKTKSTRHTLDAAVDEGLTASRKTDLTCQPTLDSTKRKNQSLATTKPSLATTRRKKRTTCIAVLRTTTKRDTALSEEEASVATIKCEVSEAVASNHAEASEAASAVDTVVTARASEAEAEETSRGKFRTEAVESTEATEAVNAVDTWKEEDTHTAPNVPNVPNVVDTLSTVDTHTAPSVAALKTAKEEVTPNGAASKKEEGSKKEAASKKEASEAATVVAEVRTTANVDIMTEPEAASERK